MTALFKKQYVVLFIGLTAFIQWGYSQGQLVPLSGNDVIKKAHKQLPKQQKSSEFIYYEPILLPFIDDFSDYTGYPDTALWIGRQAYVNQSFAVAPPTIGCVTLDAVNERGFVYDHATTSPFPADTLLSKPIRLDSIFTPFPQPLRPADSVYFSFFYQPGGGLGEPWNRLGDAPETEDSLLLEFGYQTGNIVLLYYITDFQMIADTLRPGDTLLSICNPNLYIVVEDYYFPGDILEVPCDSVNGMETIWEKVWSDEGRTLKEFITLYGDTCKIHGDKYQLCGDICKTHNYAFRQVMIPIMDAKYFNRGFQFRFRNYASIELHNNIAQWGSNVDFWNIDYVRLDKWRNQSDTAIDDVAFVYNPGSLLQKYTAMPWNQFQNSELRDTFTNYLTNLWINTKNSSYKYRILDEDWNVIALHNPQTQNIEPFYSHGYQDARPHRRPELIAIPFPTTSSDSLTIFVQHIFREEANGDQHIKNDTVVYTQKFHNYYAYDDGTPEAGYVVTSSLNPYKKSLALQFSLNKKDTLRAVDMYLNHTMNNSTLWNFTLTVWEHKDTIPGKELYAREVSQEYSSDLYGFQRFYLEEPIEVSGKFYIGYQITGQNKLLNVGFDQNTDASAYTFWQTNGWNWNREFIVGTPMIRPVLGRPLPCVGIAEPTASFEMKLYPNPAKDLLYIAIPEEMKGRDMTASIYAVTGQKIYEQPYRAEIAISNFAPGFYMLQLTDNQNNIKSIRKFSIIK